MIPNGIITHYTLYINYTNGSEISNKTVDSQFKPYFLNGVTPYQLVGVSMVEEKDLSQTMSTIQHNRQVSLMNEWDILAIGIDR